MHSCIYDTRRTITAICCKKFVRGIMHLVSLCLLLELPTSEALVNRKDVRGCKSGIWYAEPDKEGGGTQSFWLGVESPYPQWVARTVRLGT
jgi:hypothetical protein